jgi:2-keto-4-pentenoate hydratase/2-oxohepta-3-ene-1,7-dioic acid hydratase in catechol pathway
VGNATGTYLKSGDEVEAEIEGIGVLISPIIHESEWLEAIESEE